MKARQDTPRATRSKLLDGIQSAGITQLLQSYCSVTTVLLLSSPWGFILGCREDSLNEGNGSNHWRSCYHHRRLLDQAFTTWATTLVAQQQAFGSTLTHNIPKKRYFLLYSHFWKISIYLPVSKTKRPVQRKSLLRGYCSQWSCTYLCNQSTCKVHCSLLVEKGLLGHKELCAHTRAKQCTAHLQDEKRDEL